MVWVYILLDLIRRCSSQLQRRLLLSKNVGMNVQLLVLESIDVMMLIIAFSQNGHWPSARKHISVTRFHCHPIAKNIM